jgi:hypothetical protein
VLAVGCIGYKFYFDAVVPAKQASDRIREHTDLMDVVQDAAITLTDIISQLNDYALQNAERIVSTVDGAKGMLTQLPGGHLIATSNYFTKGDNLAKGIRRVAATSKDAVREIRDSITKADASRISAHLADS